LQVYRRLERFVDWEIISRGFAREMKRIDWHHVDGIKGKWNPKVFREGNLSAFRDPDQRSESSNQRSLFGQNVKQ
jgi:hypothetical protein